MPSYKLKPNYYQQILKVKNQPSTIITKKPVWLCALNLYCHCHKKRSIQIAYLQYTFIIFNIFTLTLIDLPASLIAFFYSQL